MDEDFDAEELFPPRPGGMVETARRNAVSVTAAEITPPKVGPVTVKVNGPDMFAAKTITLAAGASALAMPADPGRAAGLVNMVSTAGQAVIARDRSAADTGTGYVLLAGQPPVPVAHTREVWLSNPGDASVQVSVLTESYSSE